MRSNVRAKPDLTPAQLGPAALRELLGPRKPMRRASPAVRGKVKRKGAVPERFKQ
jgi:hypothetical protein